MEIKTTEQIVDEIRENVPKFEYGTKWVQVDEMIERLSLPLATTGEQKDIYACERISIYRKKIIDELSQRGKDD